MIRAFLLLLLSTAIHAYAAPAVAPAQNPPPPPPQIKWIRGQKFEQITLTGKIRSRHARFRKGKSIPEYYLSDDQGRKTKLPSNYRVDKNGKSTGMNLKPLKFARVELTAWGRTIPQKKGDPKIVIKKILTVKRLDPPPKPATVFKPQLAPPEK